MEVRTNGFGSFSGQFVLPSPCLTGYFSLRAADTSVSFKVEEYKRPTFDVTFEPVKVEYQVGDSIEVVGMAKTLPVRLCRMPGYTIIYLVPMPGSGGLWAEVQPVGRERQ